MKKVNRRDFFMTVFSKADLSRKAEDLVDELPLRPPVSLIGGFEGSCLSCDSKSCSLSCPEKVIRIGDDLLPYLDFAVSGCSLCGDCVVACPFSFKGSDLRLSGTIKIDRLSCISWNGTICYSCKDRCSYAAIKFQGILKPSIDDNCTLCGFCISSCQSDAIFIEGMK